MRILQDNLMPDYEVSRMSIRRAHKPGWEGATEVHIVLTHAHSDVMPQIKLEFMRSKNNICILVEIITSVVNVHMLPMLKNSLARKGASLIREFFS